MKVEDDVHNKASLTYVENNLPQFLPKDVLTTEERMLRWNQKQSQYLIHHSLLPSGDPITICNWLPFAPSKIRGICRLHMPCRGSLKAWMPWKAGCAPPVMY